MSATQVQSRRTHQAGDGLPLSLRLDPSLVAAVDELAASDERSRSWVLRKAVEEYLARHSVADPRST